MEKVYDYRQFRDEFWERVNCPDPARNQRVREKLKGLCETKRTNPERERAFLQDAELLRAFAEQNCGRLEVRIDERAVGRLSIVCKTILHTLDALDNTRFLFGMLFLKYEMIYADTVDGELRITVVKSLG